MKSLVVIWALLLIMWALFQPNAPSALSVTASGSGRVDLSFTDNSSDEDSFEVERKTGSGGTWSTRFYVLDANVHRYYDYSVRPNTT